MLPHKQTLAMSLAWKQIRLGHSVHRNKARHYFAYLRSHRRFVAVRPNIKRDLSRRIRMRLGHMKLQKKASFGRAACSSRSPPPLPLPRCRCRCRHRHRFATFQVTLKCAGLTCAVPIARPLAGRRGIRTPASPTAISGRYATSAGREREIYVARNGPAKTNRDGNKRAEALNRKHQRGEEEALADAARHGTPQRRSLARGTRPDVFGSVNSASTFFK